MLDPGVVAKVDQQPQLVAGRPEIVVHLSAMLVSKLGHRLDFKDDLPEADKVGHVLLLQRTPFIRQRQPDLRLK